MGLTGQPWKEPPSEEAYPFGAERPPLVRGRDRAGAGGPAGAGGKERERALRGTFESVT